MPDVAGASERLLSSSDCGVLDYPSHSVAAGFESGHCCTRRIHKRESNPGAPSFRGADCKSHLFTLNLKGKEGVRLTI